VPNKDTCGFPEKRAESKKAKHTPNPETNNQDLEKIIRPSKNRAIAQKMIQTASPTTKSKPLEISIEILVKGKKKSGNNTITKKSDKNDSFSNIFVLMGLSYHTLILKHNVDKSIFHINHFFNVFTFNILQDNSVC